jgi:hypothetical protein
MKKALRKSGTDRTVRPGERRRVHRWHAAVARMVAAA